MVKFVLWIFVIYGITQIIVDSELFSNIRTVLGMWNTRLGKLVNCMLCTSVWVAFAVSYMLWSPSESVFLVDLVDVEALNRRIDYDSDSEFKSAINMVSLHITLAYNRVRFMFVDGMFGSAIVWFIYLIERLISSMINFFNNYSKKN